MVGQLQGRDNMADRLGREKPAPPMAAKKQQEKRGAGDKDVLGTHFVGVQRDLGVEPKFFRDFQHCRLCQRCCGVPKLLLALPCW